MENNNQSKPMMLKKILEHGFTYLTIADDPLNYLPAVNQMLRKAIPINVDFYLPSKIFKREIHKACETSPFNPPIVDHPFWLENEELGLGYLCFSRKEWEDKGTRVELFERNFEGQIFLSAHLYVRETMRNDAPIENQVNLAICLKDKESIYRSIAAEFHSVLLSVYKLLNAKNILLEEQGEMEVKIHPALKHNKKDKTQKIKTYGPSVIDKEIAISANKESVNNILPDRYRGKGFTERFLREHFVIGHYKYFTEERPMFGDAEKFGWYWWECQKSRGNKKKGKINRTYKIE